MSKNGTHFYQLSDLPGRTLQELIRRAKSWKSGDRKVGKPLSGRELLLLFFNSSLRTRTSFEVGIRRAGGASSTIDMQGKSVYDFEFEDGTVMDGTTAEHIREAAGVLSRYGDGIAIRACRLFAGDGEKGPFLGLSDRKRDRILNAFLDHATVPVINMESNRFHPCQGLGDMLTLRETFPEPVGTEYLMTWTYHPKPLPVATPHSQLRAAALLGMNVTLAHPEGWDLDEDVLNNVSRTANKNGGNFRKTNNMDEGMKNTRVVCAKSWAGVNQFGRAEEEREMREKHRDWIVDGSRMKKTDAARFMHCLPVRRNVVVSDDVLDSDASIVMEQAENRMWAQMSLLTHLFDES